MDIEYDKFTEDTKRVSTNTSDLENRWTSCSGMGYSKSRLTQKTVSRNYNTIKEYNTAQSRLMEQKFEDELDFIKYCDNDVKIKNFVTPKISADVQPHVQPAIIKSVQEHQNP